MMQVFRFVFALTALLWFAAPSVAQRVLIETSTLASAREAASIYVHSAMFSGPPETGPVLLPGPARLPGGEQPIPLHISTDEAFAFASSVSQQPGAPHIVSAIRTAPFEPIPRWDHIVEAGWRVDAVTTMVAAGVGQRYLIIAESSRADASVNRMRIITLGRTLALRESPRSLHPLPGRAAALVPMPDSARVAVLCEPDPSGPLQGAPAVLHIHEVFTGHSTVEAKPLPGDEQGLLHASPVALVLNPERTHLMAIVTGESLREGMTGPVSWLYALDAATGEVSAAPLELPGAATQKSILPKAAASLDERGLAATWVVTHSPRLRYGHLIRAVLLDDEWRLDVRQPLGGAVLPPLIATPGGMPGVAIVAVGNRLELWPDGLFSGVSHAFDEPVRALAVDSTRVLAGVGNQVHALLLPTLMPYQELTLPRGEVRDLHIIPHAGPADDMDGDGLGIRQEQVLGTDPFHPDTDRDGIHDGIDPTPLEPGPRLGVARLIVLQSEGIGTEVHEVPLETDMDDDALRMISVDSQDAPWLVVSPRSWRGPGSFYLGVDRAWHGAFPQAVDAQVTVRMVDSATNEDVHGSPAEITVRVLPPRSSMRRVLWLLDGLAAPSELRAGLGPGFAETSRLLAAAPHLFSHAVARTAPDDLSAYSIIVVDGASVARGAILRQAMLEYVAGGGSLLFLAGPQEGDAARTVARWLLPAGIRMSPGRVTLGELPSVGTHPLAQSWDNLEGGIGSLLSAEYPAQVLVRAPAPPYGQNQDPIAQDPIRQDPVSQDRGALVATDYGRGRIAALAGPGPLHDRNMLRVENRRFVQRLFTWLASAGLETAGRPTDGLLLLEAGTDIEAMDEAPVITAVEPAEGPAEGGTPVLIHGRGFTPASVVSVGGQPALSTRYASPEALRIETPPSPDGAAGVVPIRVNNPGVSIAGIRPDAFQYTPRSVLHLSMRALGMASGVYNNALVLSMEEPPVPVGLIAIRLRAAAPPGTLQWGRAQPGRLARDEQRSVTSVVDASGDIFVTVGLPRGQSLRGGELAVVPIQVYENLPEPIIISNNWNRVLAPHGEPLSVSLRPVSVAPP